MGRETSAPTPPPPPPPPPPPLLLLPPPQAKVTATKANTKTATSLAPGFRFHPTDEELVSYYLKRKVCNKPFRFNAIAEVDIYRNEPWDLAGKSKLKTRDQEWYFFSALDKKYGNGARMNRATGKGYWKATGKDREIRRESQTVGMKKTLVFHSGRAPDGKRTNWVMHEYRLVDEELEKIGAMQDAFVLCRIFHKSNIGPPNGNRYAPFMEEEWDDGVAALVPGEDAGDDVAVGDDVCIETDGIDDVEQDTQSINNDSLGGDELPRGSQNVLSACKSEGLDDCPSLCVLNTQAPLPLLQYKRRRHNDLGSNHSNASENSTRTTQGPSSSTSTTAATTTMATSSMMTALTTSAATRTAVSALLEFSQMESIDPKESSHVRPPTFNAANLDSSMPPSCAKLIKNLQNEVHKISVERETLRLEMMSSQYMLNMLQSRIDLLNKENEDLRKAIRDA